MARPRGFPQGRTRQSVPKGREWGIGPGGTVSISIGAGTVIVGDGATPTVSKLTIMRTRGEILLAVESLGAAGDDVSLFFGMGIVSTDAFTVGSAAVPGPATDISFPWMWWNVIHFNPKVDALGIDGVTSVRVPVDVKAMRKFGVDQVLGLVAQFQDEQGTIVVDISANFRMLTQWAGD